MKDKRRKISVRKNQAIPKSSKLSDSFNRANLCPVNNYFLWQNSEGTKGYLEVKC